MASSTPSTSDKSTIDKVKEYYGKVLKTSDDLQSNACCTAVRPPKHIISAMEKLSEEVLSKYYGCGLTIPDELTGLSVMDLGCGAGRDCYILSCLVGQTGHVTGIDMTDEQLEVARRNIPYHMESFHYTTPNIEFVQGYIEDLATAGIRTGSLDLIVSNCVINLSPNKEAVLREAYRVLKTGGELYFSDVYADRRVPKELVDNPVLYGECISGALYWNDFINLAKKVGFTDPRLVEDHVITIRNPRIEELVGHIKFYSATYRLWKLDNLENQCEDYGQAVIYKGTISTCPKAFTLDAHHVIEAGKVFPVCGNTFSMLHDTRFAPHFTFIGDRSTHYGIYADCGYKIPFKSATASPCAPSKSGGSCC
ncbi:methyltransferase type 11 [Pelomyxa schiedti]|nr:methyltransferase type 11 [Pelomyxa schiedti]